MVIALSLAAISDSAKEVAVLLGTPAVVNVLVRLVPQEAQSVVHCKKQGSRLAMLRLPAALLSPAGTSAAVVVSEFVLVTIAPCFAEISAAARTSAEFAEAPAAANVALRPELQASQLVVHCEKQVSVLAIARLLPAPVSPFVASAPATAV